MTALMGDKCPTCGADHSTAELAAERIRARVAAAQAPSSALVPMDAQLDVDGRQHELDGRHERARLFEPAPAQIPGQTSLGLDELEQDNAGA